MFGSEEVEGSVPAIASARAAGIDAHGPIPADVVFLKARDGEYDLVLAMYHDQANMAAKMLGFGEVVTLLAGLRRAPFGWKTGCDRLRYCGPRHCR